MLSASGALAGLGEKVRLALAADAVLHFLGVVGAFRIAASVGQERAVQRFLGSRQNGLNLRSEIMAAGKVEAHGPATAAAIVAVTFAQGMYALLFLLATIFPRGYISCEDRTAHRAVITLRAYRPVAKKGGAATVPRHA